jgi:hypothetical protein
MLLYMHGKFTMACRYCLNVAIDTWKVYNGIYNNIEGVPASIVNFACIYSNIQAVPASHCELSVYV